MTAKPVAEHQALRYRRRMLASRPTVLLTGFGPFPRVQINATAILVPKIAAAAADAFPGLRFVAETLPTEWVAGPERAAHLYAMHRPHLAVHFGVSHRATGFAIEARARNRCAPTPDAVGSLPACECLSVGGPDYLPTGLPAALIVGRLRQRGLPAQISRDAGGYLCNALMYRALELARRDGHPARTGFVHLPETLVDPRRPWRGPRAGSLLSWAEVIAGGLEIIAASLGRHRYTAPAVRSEATGRLSPSPFSSAGERRST